MKPKDLQDAQAIIAKVEEGTADRRDLIALRRLFPDSK
jgi:hypothetical protein